MLRTLFAVALAILTGAAFAQTQIVCAEERDQHRQCDPHRVLLRPWPDKRQEIGERDCRRRGASHKGKPA